MSDAKQCDKCKKLVGPNKYALPFMKNFTLGLRKKKIVNFDLCDDCNFEFRKFMGFDND